MKSGRQLDREIAESIAKRRGDSNPGRHVAHHALITHEGQHWKGSKIQSLLFDKEWTPSEAKDWAESHGYRSAKVHVTDNYIRLRQFAPTSGRQKRTITLGQGIKAVIEQVR